MNPSELPPDQPATVSPDAPTPTEPAVAPEVSAPVETVTAPEASAESAAPEAAVEAAPEAPREPALPPQPIPDVPPAPQPHDLSRIAQDLQIRKAQVEAVVQLLDDENTVPFITRYRKERTGGLNEEVIRRIQARVGLLRALADRKRTIFKSIAFQRKLTDDLVAAVLAADTPKRLEDLYLPYKPRKKSKATEAREKGLGPVAEAIFHRDPAVANLNDVLPGLVDPDKWLLNVDDVLAGVKEVLAEMVSDSAEVRGPMRAFTWDTGVLVSTRIETVPEGKGREYEPYFDFREPVKDIPPHRVLAINRGEKFNVLRVRIDTPPDIAKEIVQFHLRLADHPHRELMEAVAFDALDRLVKPSLDREVRRELAERAQDSAIQVFAKNLRSLLLQPPLRGKKVLAVDPGIRTGCKLAALDATGKLLEDAVVYPLGQKKNADHAKRKLEQMVRKYQISVVAIGNGTACRDAEELVAGLIADLKHRRENPNAEPAPEPVIEAPPAPEPVAPPVVEAPPAPAPVAEAHAAPSPETAPAVEGAPATEGVPAAPPVEGAPAPVAEAPAVPAVPPPPVAPPAPPPPPPISLEGLEPAPEDLAYVIVIEAGASDYSASPVAREEFPDLDATTRGTISIGRRLQDPLAELVKIDPQHIGVGLYQHDVKPKQLKDSLEGVIESSVNQVGVELNTASVPLLRHVSGLNQLVAREIVTYREKNGAFTSREQLLQVPGLGEKRFTQAAGFLKLPDGPDPLDATWIHPESYAAARQVLADFGFTAADLRDKAKVEELRGKLNESADKLEEIAGRLNIGAPTLDDIFRALARPGRDPREDLPPPIFKTGVLKLEDITPGMELKGTVLNVVPFGAFVDIGLKESGLVHISQMSARYIKSPYDAVAVGDVVTVWVKEVKPGEKKISLSMVPPAQERQPFPPRGGDRGGERNDRQDRGARGDAPPRDRPPQQQQQRGPDRGPPPSRGAAQRQGAGAGNRFNRGPGGPPPPQQPQQQQPAQAAPPPPPVPPPPPKKPGKPKPIPVVSQDQVSGKKPVFGFDALAAVFKKRAEGDQPKPEVKPEEPKPEEPKPEGGA